MFENEYRALMEHITPGKDLQVRTEAKMKELLQKKQKAPRFRRGTVLMAALILLGVIGVSAFALTQVRMMDWYGNEIVREPLKHPLSPSAREALMARMDSAPDDELWLAEYASGWQTWHYPREAFTSFEELEKRIKSSDAELLVPTVIPEGFHFVSGMIWFYASDMTKYFGLMPLGEETTAEGITIQKYQIPDAARNYIESYSMSFQNGQGIWFHIKCKREDASSNYFIPVEEDESSEPVTVAGMEKGFHVYGLDRNTHALYLRKTDMRAKIHYHWPVPQLASESFRVFGGAEYTLDAKGMDKDQLIKIAEGLQ